MGLNNLTFEDELRAQVAVLREALDNVLHTFVWRDSTMNAEYWALRALPKSSISEVAKPALAALAVTTADALAWLARKEKLAAAAELDQVHDWVRMGHYEKDDARDEIARACHNRAAQLRQEAGE